MTENACEKCIDNTFSYKLLRTMYLVKWLIMKYSSTLFDLNQVL